MKPVLYIRIACVVSILSLLSLGACKKAEKDSEGGGEIEYYFSTAGIAELKARFVLDSLSGWYQHQLWKDSIHLQSGLFAMVNENGYYVLSSRYVGEGPISHRQIRVLIGDQQFTSQVVNRTDAEHKEVYEGSQLVETNAYTDYRDGVILENIADSGEQPVVVEYLGGTEKASAPLPEADREALLDCFQLLVLNRMKGQ